MSRWLLMPLMGLGLLATHRAASQMDEERLLLDIRSLQVREDPFYDQGWFRSERTVPWLGGAVEDNNLFFTAYTLLILRDLQPWLSASSQMLVDSIYRDAKQQFHHYQSRKQEASFNFWQTRPQDIAFPNDDTWLPAGRFRLPDDLLSSSLVAQVQSDNDSLGMAIRQKMLDYVARKGDFEVENESDILPPGGYYPFWYADKMDQYADVLTIAMVLTHVFDEQYPLQDVDHASIAILKSIISKGDYFDDLASISFVCDRAPVILYQLARLFVADTRGVFADQEAILIQHLRRALSGTEHPADRDMLRSSLLRLGVLYHGGEGTQTSIDSVHHVLSVQLISPTEVKGMRLLSGTSIRWSSLALNYALRLEYLLLNKKAKLLHVKDR